jgi:hypothetical protein
VAETEAKEIREIAGLTRGRIVHYVPGPQRIPSNWPVPAYLAAMINGVIDKKTGTCDLLAYRRPREHLDLPGDDPAVLAFHVPGIVHSEDPKAPNTWHWPTRCGCV